MHAVGLDVSGGKLLPATKAIRISQSFNPEQIEVFAEIVTAAQRGAVPRIADTKAFQSLATKIIGMRQKVRAKQSDADAG